MSKSDEHDNSLTEGKEAINLGILYLSLHNLARRRYGENQIISRKELFAAIGRHFLLPKSLRPIVVKEMEDRKMIKRVDRENLRILPLDYDLEKDTNKFYQAVGLF